MAAGAAVAGTLGALKKCRLCLKLGEFYSIFAEDNSMQLSRMAMACSDVDIREGDGLPDRICGECVEKLSAAYIFKRQCERSDAELRKCPPSVSLKRPSDTSLLEVRYSSSAVDARSTEATKRRRRGEDAGPAPPPEEPPPNPLECTVCDKVFPTYRGRNAHQRIHKSDRDHPVNTAAAAPAGDAGYECEACDVHFSNKSLFVDHFYRCDGVQLDDRLVRRAIKELFCPACKRRYKSVAYLQKHVSRSVCGNAFRRYAQLTGRDPFEDPRPPPSSSLEDAKRAECPKCGARFRAHAYMLRHFGGCAPDSVSRVTCVSCGAVFTDKNDFMEHVRKTHIGIANVNAGRRARKAPFSIKEEEETLYKCPKCPKSFTYKSSLGNHIKIHRNLSEVVNTEEKCNKCDVCEKSFQYPKSLQIHMQNAHAPSREVKFKETEARPSLGFSKIPGRCLLCDIMFESRSETKQHNRMHIRRNEKPKNEYVCPECGAKFTNTKVFRDHYREHDPADDDAAPEDAVFDASISNFCEVTSDPAQQDDVARADVKPVVKNEPTESWNGVRSTTVCFVCQESFSCESQYRKHMKVHYYDKNIDPKMLVCKICDRPSKNMRSYIAHTTWHTLTGRFKCALCPETFPYRRLYDAHMTNRHGGDAVESAGPTSFRCGDCGKYYADERSLVRHGVCHRQQTDGDAAGGKRSFDCLQCTKKFHTNYRLMMHMQSSHVPREVKVEPSVKKPQGLRGVQESYSCPVCAQNFTNMLGVKRHVSKEHSVREIKKREDRETKVHDGVDRPHRCTVCTKKFPDLEQLKVHVGEHDRKPNLFKCTLCSRKSPSMKVHLLHLTRGHLVQRCPMRRLACDRCEETFVRRQELRKHLLVNHEIEENYVAVLDKEESIDPSELKDRQCHVCGKVLGTENSYQKHLLWHSVRRCNYCSQQFDSKALLNVHVQYSCDRFRVLGNSDPFEKRLACHVCSKPFSVHVKLQCHLKARHGVDPETKSPPRGVAVCDFCFSVFPSEERMLTHSRCHAGTKSLECKLCAKPVHQPNSKKHRMQHYAQSFDDSPIPCERCDQKFTTVRNYGIHFETVHGEQYQIFVPKELPLEECTLCKKPFRNLQRHMMYHDKYRCKKCSSYFFSEIAFGDHICDVSSDAEDSPEPPPAAETEDCDFCMKPFTNVYSKNKHMYNHNMVLFYGCRLCPKKFSAKATFSSHCNSHRQQIFTTSPLKCRHCEETFTKYQSYAQHMQSAHGDNETMEYCPDASPRDCLICKKTFSNIGRHYKYHAAMKCNACNKYILSQKYVDDHVCDDRNVPPGVLAEFDGDISELINGNFEEYKIPRAVGVPCPEATVNIGNGSCVPESNGGRKIRNPYARQKIKILNFPIPIMNTLPAKVRDLRSNRPSKSFDSFSPVISSTVSLSSPIPTKTVTQQQEQCDYPIKTEPVDHFYQEYHTYEYLDVNNSSGYPQ